MPCQSSRSPAIVDIRDLSEAGYIADAKECLHASFNQAGLPGTVLEFGVGTGRSVQWLAE